MIAALPFSLVSNAQFTENFSDGNYSANPVWTASSGGWIVNAALQLQSNNTVANSSFYISTANTLATTAQWEFYVDLRFATSGTNYVDVFLTSSLSDVSAMATSGYFVRIGNTADEIALYRKDAGIAAGVKLIDGADGIVSSSASNQLKIKVSRNAASQWTLYRDITGTGSTYFTEGSIADATFSNSSFFGILVKQSVAGFFQKHFFDDIEVKAFIPDITAPVVKTVTAVTANTLDVLFDEPLDINSIQPVTNYTAGNILGTPATAVLDAANTSLLHLAFSSNFISGVNYQLTINNVKDLAGNAVANATAGFVYFAPYTARQYDVVIDEIMADPAPPVSLPNNEWIELRNTSAAAINLLGFRIGDAQGQSGPLPGFILLPDSFVIVCAAGSSGAMSAFGRVVAVTAFPSLDNTAGQLYLKSPQGNMIYSVSYKDSWYQNELKKAGGWSMEMIDTKNPCGGFGNWKASSDARGGSPGKKNAVDAVNPDKGLPGLQRAYPTDSLHITLVFDEPLDSGKAAAAGSYSISDGVGVAAGALVLAPAFDRVSLQLNTALARNKIYKITVSGVVDCVGNTIGNKNTARVGLSEAAAVNDIVINEILFNPPPSGADYVEIYNRGKTITDLKQTYIASRNSSGAVSGIAQLSAENYLLFPQDFMVVTEKEAAVKAGYIFQNPEAFIEIPVMPSFNDDKGTVVILNGQGQPVDELSYSDKWHFKLIDNKEGIALERIDYNAATQLPDNWHSAATSSGYGTPGYKNSQYRVTDGLQGEVKLSPEIVSPDNDGQDDFATIDYNFAVPGYTANITIFNASGRPVRYLRRNALCGTRGSFSWDGLGEKSQPLATGVYVVFMEVFNLTGNRKQFKNTIVVARR